MNDKVLDIQTFQAAAHRSPAELFVDACAILAAQGHACSLAGQVSLREEGEGALRMWTQPLGTGMEEATTDSLLVVDERLETLKGKGRANPGARFHAWIYKHHPAVRAIVHTHPPAVSAFSMLGIPLPVAHMDACMFFEDCGFLERWPGVPTGDEEGELISAALGGRRTAFLANHGCVCTGASLKEAVYLNVFAERAARMALDALAAGSIRPIDRVAGREAHDFLLQESIVDATFDYWLRQARS
jgi:L-fuculose-phosphate aldolase